MTGDGLADVRRRLRAERYAPVWKTDPERAARARRNGPTEQWRKHVAQDQIDMRRVLRIDDYRRETVEIQQKKEAR